MWPLPMEFKPYVFGEITFMLRMPHDGYLRSINQGRNFGSVYWGKVWPAAVAMCEYLVANTALVEGKKVLELAAGVGLPGMVASLSAASTTISDCEQPAVDLLRHNTQFNMCETVHCRLLDWTALPDDVFEAEVLLLSDVNYDPAQFDVLYEVMQRFLRNGTTILLSTPQRLLAKPFIEMLLPLVIHQEERFIGQGKGSAWMSIFILKNNPA